MPEIPIDELTTKQSLRLILEGVTNMAQEIDNLNAAVEKELADDTAQNELIAELQRQLADAAAAVEAAQAGEADALAQAAEALSGAQSAADRLATNDAPVEEPGEGA